MEKRLQLLLDRERYDKVAAEAARSGRSVAAVIREAIDLRFGDYRDAERRAAASRLLASMEASDDEPPYSVEELRTAYEEDLLDRFERASRQHP